MNNIRLQMAGKKDRTSTNGHHSEFCILLIELGNKVKIN